MRKQFERLRVVLGDRHHRLIQVRNVRAFGDAAIDAVDAKGGGRDAGVFDQELRLDVSSGSGPWLCIQLARVNRWCTGGLMIGCFLLAVRHAVIDGYLRLVKRRCE